MAFFNFWLKVKDFDYFFYMFFLASIQLFWKRLLQLHKM